MLIEQAVFTSARTSHGSGYHLVARSAGISPEQAAELAVWGPSHGSLRDERDDATSVNFHRLSQGQFCVSKSLAAGEEYSQRGGARVYTQFLLVPEPVLARFANYPFAVLRAAWAKGLLEIPSNLPTSLRPFTLAGRTARVDEGLLAQMSEELGPERVGRLISAAVLPGMKVLTGLQQCEAAFAGLLNCLPVECRTEISFTTGLRFSPRRPFKLLPLEDDREEQRRVARHEEVLLVDLRETDASDQPLHGWAAYVSELIEADRLTTLAGQLQLGRPGLTLEQLDELGEQLLADFRKTSSSARARSRAAAAKANPPAPSATKDTSLDIDTLSPLETRPASTTLRMHTPTLIDLGATKDPAAVDLVERLDDAIYDAINGIPDARELATMLWNELSERLPPKMVDKLREQYLRYTLSLWEACLDTGLREPAKAAGSLDILSLLFESESS